MCRVNGLSLLRILAAVFLMTSFLCLPSSAVAAGEVGAPSLAPSPPGSIDLGGSWEGTAAITSFRSSEKWRVPNSPLNEQRSQRLLLTFESQQSGKARMADVLSALVDVPFSYSDGRLTASFDSVNSGPPPQYIHFRLDASIEATGGGYTLQGTWKHKYGVLEGHPDDQWSEIQGSIKVSKAAPGAAPLGPPKAAFSYEPKSPKAQDQVKFSDQSSYPGGAAGYTQTWYVDGDKKGTGQSLTWELPDAKQHKVKLAVARPDGAKDEIEHTVPPTNYDMELSKVLVFQSVEGGELVAWRPTAVRAFVTWPDPETTPTAKVDLLIDGKLFESTTFVLRSQYTPPQTFRNENSANFHIPQDRLEPGNHSFTVRAEIPKSAGLEQIVDPNPANNELALGAKSFVATRGWKIVAAPIHPDVGAEQLAAFVGPASDFLFNAYPLRGVEVVTLPNLAPTGAYYTAQKAVVELRWKLQALNSQLKEKGQAVAKYAVGVYPRGWLSENGRSHWWARESILVRADSPATLAHEIGHGFLGSAEEYTSDSTGILLGKGNIYDGRARKIIDVALPVAPQYVNFMGNADTAPTWVNADTWNKLVQSLRVNGSSGGYRIAGLAAPPLPVDEPTVEGFLLTGALGKDGTPKVELPLFLQGLTAPPSQNPEPTPYLLEALASGGNTIGSVAVYVEAGQEDPSPFLAVLPARKTEVASLILKKEGKAIWSAKNSANAPKLTVESPSSASPLSGNLEVRWQASDLDGDPLSYALFYSPNDGEIWLPLVHGLAETKYSLPLDRLPGGQRVRLRVLASDGLNTAAATTEGFFAVATKPPAVVITSPKDGSSQADGESLVFLASAYDPQQGALAGDSITWTSDRDGKLGSGQRLEVARLSPGRHTITAGAQNAAGNSAQATMQLSVGDTAGKGSEDDSDAMGLVVVGLLVGGLSVLAIRRHQRAPARASATAQAATVPHGAARNSVEPAAPYGKTGNSIGSAPPQPPLRAAPPTTQPAAPAAAFVPRFCGQCGEPLPRAARFCGSCGAPMGVHIPPGSTTS